MSNQGPAEVAYEREALREALELLSRPASHAGDLDNLERTLAEIAAALRSFSRAPTGLVDPSMSLDELLAYLGRERRVDTSAATELAARLIECVGRSSYDRAEEEALLAEADRLRAELLQQLHSLEVPLAQEGTGG